MVENEEVERERERSRRARLNGRAELFWELRHKTMYAEGRQGGLWARNL